MSRRRSRLPQRLALIDALAARRDAEASWRLVEALGGSHAEVVEAAHRALRAHGPALVPLLRVALRRTSPKLAWSRHQAIVRLLGELGGPDCVADLLGAETPWYSLPVVRALVELGPRIAPRLVDALDEGDVLPRRLALHALRALGVLETTPGVAAAVARWLELEPSALRHGLTDAANWTLRELAAAGDAVARAVLAERDPPRPATLALRDLDQAVAAGDLRAIDLAAALARDPERTGVVHEVAAVVGRASAPALREALRERLHEWLERSPWRAVEALGRVGDTRDIPVLRARCTPDNLAIEPVVLALARLGDPELAAHLRHILPLCRTERFAGPLVLAAGDTGRADMLPVLRDGLGRLQAGWHHAIVARMVRLDATPAALAEALCEVLRVTASLPARRLALRSAAALPQDAAPRDLLEAARALADEATLAPRRRPARVLLGEALLAQVALAHTLAPAQAEALGLALQTPCARLRSFLGRNVHGGRLALTDGIGDELAETLELLAHLGRVLRVHGHTLREAAARHALAARLLTCDRLLARIAQLLPSRHPDERLDAARHALGHGILALLATELAESVERTVLDAAHDGSHDALDLVLRDARRRGLLETR